MLGSRKPIDGRQMTDVLCKVVADPADFETRSESAESRRSASGIVPFVW